MDSLFERRSMTKKVHIFSKFLQRNMQASILAQLKMNFEGKCSAEGFIQRNSITIVNYSLGRTNYIKGGVDYDVQFQADVCMPHAGQIFKAPVTVRSKIGIHAETPPIKVLIPRDLHIGNEKFEAIQIGDKIRVEIKKSRFQVNDKYILSVGEFKEIVEAPAQPPAIRVETADVVGEPAATAAAAAAPPPMQPVPLSAIPEENSAAPATATATTVAAAVESKEEEEDNEGILGAGDDVPAAKGTSIGDFF
jgi:DNA-directed RNA polymerase subunit E'/Rpb7